MKRRNTCQLLLGLDAWPCFAEPRGLKPPCRPGYLGPIWRLGAELRRPSSLRWMGVAKHPRRWTR
jgi:hypothetical protein